MTWLFLLLFAQAPADGDREVTALIAQILQSGRVVEDPPSQRVSPPAQIAPGAPPLLSFRFFEGRDRHRFGKLDLVMDDAGH
jgi:hypothetical protein